MKKRFSLVCLAAVLSLAFNTVAFAGEWKSDSTGWWYVNDDGTYPVNSWNWIDGNKDGTAECYYFNEHGYMLANTNTPDGYTVNENGAWTVNGVVQTKVLEQNVDDSLSEGTKDDTSNWLSYYLDNPQPNPLGSGGSGAGSWF